MSQAVVTSNTRKCSRYRRGKPESNDVDIVISHPGLRSGADEVKGLCAKLVRQLYDRGMMLLSSEP